MKYPKRSQYNYAKSRYRVRNWAEYEAGLQNRGDFTCLDTERVYEVAQMKGDGHAVRVLIPPGRNARLSPRSSAAQRERNPNVRSIRELGRLEGQKRSGYSKRAMVENAIYRYKTIIGRRMRSRTFAGQRVEVQLASKILNTMTRLGMPDSYRAE